MITEILVLLTAAATFAGALLRARRWSNPRSRPMTLALVALGVALLFRAPVLGDQVLDSLLAQATGRSNVPDLVAHLLTLAAAGAVSAHVLIAFGRADLVRAAWISEALCGALLIPVWVLHGSDEPAVNMVQLHGMSPYSILFSLGLLAPQTLIVAAIRRARPATRHEKTVLVMLWGAGAAGAAFAGHRIAAVVYPPIERWNYSAITWTLTLLCIGLYGTAAVANLSGRRRSAPACAADDPAHRESQGHPGPQ